MTDQTPSSVKVQVHSGDTVVAPARNPFASATVQGLILAGITALVRKYLPEEFHSQAIDIALQIVQWGVAGAMIVWGRWTAKQQLGFGRVPKEGTVKILLLGLLLAGGTGCMTRASHVAILEGLSRADGNEANEYLEWASAIAGDANRDGHVDASDEGVQNKLVPDLSAFTPAARDAWVSVKYKRAAEKRALYEQALRQSREGINAAFVPAAPKPVEPGREPLPPIPD